jgi:xanthine dehydrogenase accessory factor
VLHRDQDILSSIANWQSAGQKVALATVLSTWGSAPRSVGALLGVNEAGEFTGSVSGGCVEASVVKECQYSMQTDQPKILEFGVTDDEAFEVGLACGGKIQILIEPFKCDDSLVPECLESFDKRIHKVLIRQIPSGTSKFLDDWRHWLAVDQAKAITNSGFIENEPGLFAHIFSPEPRVFIVGGVHIAQAMCEVLKQVQITPVIIDPRAAWANKERFPGVQIIPEWPDDAFKALGLDRGTAVVTLTHDSKFDDPALIAALRSDAFYVGALGGRKTNEKRAVRFKSLGITQDELDHLHSPVGLSIGAKNPAEIAVSIAAEIIQVRRQG